MPRYIDADMVKNLILNDMALAERVGKDLNGYSDALFHLKTLPTADVVPREELERLEEENERLRASSVDYRNIPYFVADAKADTVRKMAERIEKRCIKGGIYPVFVAKLWTR